MTEIFSATKTVYQHILVAMDGFHALTLRSIDELAMSIVEIASDDYQWVDIEGSLSSVWPEASRQVTFDRRGGIASLRVVGEARRDPESSVIAGLEVVLRPRKSILIKILLGHPSSVRELEMELDAEQPSGIILTDTEHSVVGAIMYAVCITRYVRENDDRSAARVFSIFSRHLLVGEVYFLSYSVRVRARDLEYHPPAFESCHLVDTESGPWISDGNSPPVVDWNFLNF